MHVHTPTHPGTAIPPFTHIEKLGRERRFRIFFFNRMRLWKHCENVHVEAAAGKFNIWVFREMAELGI